MNRSCSGFSGFDFVTQQQRCLWVGESVWKMWFFWMRATKGQHHLPNPYCRAQSFNLWQTHMAKTSCFEEEVMQRVPFLCGKLLITHLWAQKQQLNHWKYADTTKTESYLPNTSGVNTSLLRALHFSSPTTINSQCSRAVIWHKQEALWLLLLKSLIRREVLDAGALFF